VLYPAVTNLAVELDMETRMIEGMDHEDFHPSVETEPSRLMN
jgi:hypothetical protein